MGAPTFTNEEEYLARIAAAIAGPVFATALTSVANDAYLTIQPATGEEALVTTVFYGAAMELYLTDGTTSQLILGSDATSDNMQALSIAITNTLYLKMKNKSGGAASNMAAIGYYTKQA